MGGEDLYIHDSRLVGRTLTSRISVPRGLRKYFKSRVLFAGYDADILADRSILNIPLLAAVLPFAWLTGSDIYVDELDRTFKESMDELKQMYGKMYPRTRFTTRINADVLVDNNINIADPSERSALLFSGGVDSTFSLITNMSLKPRLIMIWGVNRVPYPWHREHWEKTISEYSEFAGRHGLALHVIKTNITRICDEWRIAHDFHELLYDGGFRARLQHSLVLLPLAAPLSFGRFDQLLIAASLDPTDPQSRAPRAWGHQPSMDEKIVWSRLKVKHDGYIPRIEKITGAMKEYLKNDGLTLRVCFEGMLKDDKLNCGACEKCSRTILSLVLAGIDPNKCGFKVDESTFQSIRHMIERKITPAQAETYWMPMQKKIPQMRNYDLCGSKEFFKWFEGLDFKSIRKDVWRYRDLYILLPYTISRVLNLFYQKIGIDVHDDNPIRPSENTNRDFSHA